MLEVFFCNVGDGDAVLLIEHQDSCPDYVVLVDAGRQYLEPAEGSLRKEAIYHLKSRGIESIDLMILTHLHVDHIGCAVRILNSLRVKKLSALFVPPEDAEWVAPPPYLTEKPLNGLCCALNIFSDIARTARERGTVLECAISGTVWLTDCLSMTVHLPRPEVIERHLSVCGVLYRGLFPEHDIWYRASKERNLTSLMLRFRYAGRSILLTGDRYASDWENEPAEPCDILKLPHHGDPKSMTRTLIERLHPSFAVISCQNSPDAKKDRPNAEILSLLQETVPNVMCTENREMPTLGAATHNGIRFEIQSSGSVLWGTE